MKYVVEIGSGAMIENTKFHKDSFRHSKVFKRDIQARRQHGYLISLLLFF
jgi:hypothetical protein